MIQPSSVWAGTWDCTNSVQTSGSSPLATRRRARDSVASRSVAGSWGTVMAW